MPLGTRSKYSKTKYCFVFELCNPFLRRFLFWALLASNKKRISVKNNFVGQRYIDVLHEYVKISENEIKSRGKFNCGKFRSEIIFRSTVEILGIAKLRFVKSAFQDCKWSLCESLEDIYSCPFASKGLMWMSFEISFSIGRERTSYKLCFHITFYAWRCSQFGDKMKMSPGESFSQHAMRVVSNTGWSAK